MQLILQENIKLSTELYPLVKYHYRQIYRRIYPKSVGKFIYSQFIDRF